MRNYFHFLLLMYSMLLSINAKSQDEEVNVVIATGINLSQAQAFSPDNKIVAQALYNTITFWDVKTGRMLRKANYTNGLTQVTDTIWFSEDSKKLIVGLAVSNDVFEMDCATGKSTLVKGPPFDYSTYKYIQPIRTSSSLHLYSGSKENLKFPSPDGKSELIYKVIKNPLGNSNVMPNAFEIYVKSGNKMSDPLDTVYYAMFSFSNDSRYVFLEEDIVDLESGRIVSSLVKVPYSGKSIMFLPGTKTPVTSGVNNIRIWDFPDMVDIPIEGMVNFMPIHNSSLVVAETFDIEKEERTFFIVDLTKKKRVSKRVRTNLTGYLYDVSPDGKRYSFIEINKASVDAPVTYQLSICDIDNNKVDRVIKNTTKVLFTADPNIVIIDSIGSYNRKLNLTTGETKLFPDMENAIGSAAYQVSDNHKYLMGTNGIGQDEEGNYLNDVYIWNIETEEVVFKTTIPGINISGFNLSKDEQYVVLSTSHKFDILVYNFKTGEKVHTLSAHNAIVDINRFSDDGTRLISSALDGTRRIWNLEKGHEMVSLINTGPKDFAIVTPNQYYYATKGAKKMIHFVKGLQIYPFGQFDLKYNRPDIIIKDMEASNQGLVKPFYYAYQKRLKRLGFTEEMLDGSFHMPSAEIVNKESIPVTTKTGTIKLNIAANDEQFNLDRLIVRVNEVPIHGKDGVSLRNKKLSKYNNELDIVLSEGKNVIEVSVLNEKGVESIPSNAVIDYEPEQSTKPNLYLYTLGVSEYEQADFNLNYAAKDASDIQQLYSSTKDVFNQVISKKMTNEGVTLESLQAIKDELMNTNVDDVVCLFFAGHGILDVELNYFLASHDIDFKDPGTRGIPYEAFEDILDDIPARKKLIMIDACHSGEIDKEEVALIESEGQNQTEEGDVTFRAVTSTTLQQVGLSNSFELMKELFNDVRKSSGTVIISSAGGMEYAMEGGDWNNGVFTYSFLNGIQNMKADLDQDGVIMLSEMNNYIRDEVFRLTNGKQQPTNRAEVLDQDWRIW
ncbi:caspase family protein [Paracrocinitomix mangrovi]|uniref:caspase family protein n=1 Tax=Paracrocinitomix mangrovi TaxID=2862509 RepID=UPI001C8D8B3B|nr:caspase family protein [Paracrocinitomix mangrovi]UKN02149.1 caspase family protein [Paracrocinitomix mangrovi]